MVQDQGTLGVATKRELGVGAAGGQAGHKACEVVGASSNSHDTEKKEASRRSVGPRREHRHDSLFCGCVVVESLDGRTGHLGRQRVLHCISDDAQATLAGAGGIDVEQRSTSRLSGLKVDGAGGGEREEGGQGSGDGLRRQANVRSRQAASRMEGSVRRSAWCLSSLRKIQVWKESEERK